MVQDLVIGYVVLLFSAYFLIFICCNQILLAFVTTYVSAKLVFSIYSEFWQACFVFTSYNSVRHNHLFTRSFVTLQCESMGAVEKKLKEMGIDYVRQRVEEGGIYVDQLFFHDPDGFMVEICNCDNLPVIPIAGEMARSCSRLNFQQPQQIPVVRL